MPRLSRSLLEEIENRRRALAGEVATRTHGLLWVHAEKSNKWYARHDRNKAWFQGRTATAVRNILVAGIVDDLTQEEPFCRWPETQALYGQTGRYDLYGRLKRIWSDWGAPEDLPTP